MANVALLGIFYKTKEEALKKMKEKNKQWKKDRFVVVEFANGFMVVGESQITRLRN